MNNFCTLSARNYLPKLLVLHESLLQHSSEPFTLHILAMDVETFRLLHEMQLRNVNLIPLSGFETALNMQPVKASRSRTEYFWTAASNLMQYLMPWTNGALTYLDADLIFFADPKVVFDEIGERSLGITPHRFPPHRKYMERNGIYNVAWVTAKNSDAGRRCISNWASNCRTWCFDRIEGKNACGDQKYLDDWERDYPGEVCAIENIGVNVAPWNISQWRVTEGPAVDGTPVVFYHVHELMEMDNGVIRLTNYSLREEDTRFIYAPYLDAYHAAKARILECEARLATERAALELQGQRA